MTEQIQEEVKKALKNMKEKAKGVASEVIEEINGKNEEIVNQEVNKKVEDKDKVNKTLGPKLVFDLYDISEVSVKDPGLKNVINLDYKLVIKSHGRLRERFGKGNVNIIERLVNTVSVPGHRGKKHKIITRWATGKYNKNTRQVLEALKIINEKTGKNPIQILVTAIEKGCPMDEVTMIQYGGARYPQAVDSSPLRRVSIALRNIVHGAYDKSFRSKRPFSQTLASEIIATANASGDSLAFTKKNELEKQADAAR